MTSLLFPLPAGRCTGTDAGLEAAAAAGTFLPEVKMNSDQYQSHLAKVFQQCLTVVNKKCADYAQPDDPFHNFRQVEAFGLCPLEKGILVRLTDKFSRIANLLERPAEVEDETIYDTILDAINYLAILHAYISHTNSAKPSPDVAIRPHVPEPYRSHTA